MANSGVLRNNKIIFLVIAVLMLAVFIGALTFLKNVYQTENYYVLNADVPVKGQILPEMLTPITTSDGTAPPNALKPEDLTAGAVFARYPLFTGEVLNPSAVGGLDDIAIGIPDSWIVTSFSVPADNAVGGRITRGIYFDMMVVGDNGTFYPFVNLLTLDTSISLSGASSSNAVNTPEAQAGQTSIYYVGMTPENAARLQSLVKQSGGEIKLVLSPRQNEYQTPDLAAYEGLFTFEADNYEIVNGAPGTNPAFTDVERDQLGRPVDRDEDGNVKYPVRCGNSPATAPAGEDASACETINNESYSTTTE